MMNEFNKKLNKIKFLKGVRGYQDGGSFVERQPNNPDSKFKNMFVSFSPSSDFSDNDYMSELNDKYKLANWSDDDYINNSIGDLFYKNEYDTKIGDEIIKRQQKSMGANSEDIPVQNITDTSAKDEDETNINYSNKNIKLEDEIDLDKYKGPNRNEFEKALQNVMKKDKRAKDNEMFLRVLAAKESAFRKDVTAVTNSHHGYFQLSNQNVKAYSSAKSVDEYKNNPEMQIEAALNLYDAFKKGLSKKDKELAKEKGYTMFGLIAGAWAGGNGNLRKYLEGRGDTSDSHHYEKAGKGKGLGTSVGTYVNLFSKIPII